MRAVAACVVAALLGGPLASAWCQATCLNHDHRLASTQDSGEVPSAAPEHQHHHEQAADQRASAANAATGLTTTSAASVQATGDCCLGPARVEPVDLSSVTLRALAITLVVEAPPTVALSSFVPTSCAVAHALEPPADGIPLHLSSILRI